MEQINVRKIKITDYENIYTLNQELGYLYSIKKTKERIQNITENAKDIILVAEYGTEVIGYIHGSPYELLYMDLLINVLGFVVKEKYRNNGIGNELMNNLEQWAKKNGYSGIRLSTGFDRLNAHRFYQRHGFINIKKQMNFLKIFEKANS